MSHFTSIKTQIKDVVALKAAVAELGLALLENTDARGYFNNTQHGEFVIKLQGPYDIAVNKQPDGTYGLTTDWWDGHVEREVGTQFGKLLQLYAVHKASLEARRKGLTVQRSKKQDGTIKLVIGGVR